MRSVMTHQFSRIPNAEIQRSVFDRSHGYKTTFDSGLLIPFYIDEALPGDTFSLKASILARLATPQKPIMDNLFLDTFFFAVPYRLVWTNWEKFNGAKDNPDDVATYNVPYMLAPAVTGIQELELSDYFGLPTQIASIQFDSLFHRAYNLIWNEWFRDQNIQDSVVVDKDDGPDNYSDYTAVLRRGKRHDYFTSALPWPQKGTAVTVPIGSTAPVIGVTPFVPEFTGNNIEALSLRTTNAATTVSWDQAAAGNADAKWLNTRLAADLSNATAATINSLRQAFQLQKLYERDARGGTRYTEIIKSHFGVTSPDARLQRPEYLGGGSTPVNITPVAQTAEGLAAPVGNLAGFGTAVAQGHGFSKSFTEHCLLIGLVCVRADLNYQQGMNRMFSRRTRFDFYWPALSHLGEQEILNKEIFCDGTANDALVFGYQERFAEYRYKPSSVTGVFRSNAATSLDVWHLAQDFGALPTLDSTFIEENPPVNRIVQFPDEPEFIFDSYIQLKCARPMPIYSVPGLIDHF